jgi:hypothetical protein
MAKAQTAANLPVEVIVHARSVSTSCDFPRRPSGRRERDSYAIAWEFTLHGVPYRAFGPYTSIDVTVTPPYDFLFPKPSRHQIDVEEDVEAVCGWDSERSPPNLKILVVVPAGSFDRLWNAACAGALGIVTLSLTNVPNAHLGTHVLASTFSGRKRIR